MQIIKREKHINKKYRVWERKPIPFSWWFWVEKKQQWRSKWVTWSVWEVTDKRENEQSQKVRGKTEKDFKNCPHCAKHVFFAAEVSRQIVARSTRQNFAIGSLTRKGVVSWAAKISVHPSRLDLPLVNKSPKPTCELATMACNLYDLQLSRQNKATLFFEIFSFCKIKILSKNT